MPPYLHAAEAANDTNAKRQDLGLVWFTGEIFKWNMLMERIMHECIKKLLSNIDPPEEKDIESLSPLMMTVDGLLDHKKAIRNMNAYFARMSTMLNSPMAAQAAAEQSRQAQQASKKMNDLLCGGSRGDCDRNQLGGNGLSAARGASAPPCVHQKPVTVSQPRALCHYD
ncbi:hypothetical protein PSTT_11441 [Puccinia striiformis]|uniref:MIF4G domain-containing protein n=2 Tax=Puccinia striiformis TaxID=27350 RepID=A0A2S4V0C8_9BASI|nr:hypothetical protein PSTT_11441 [Puccinia striiformis]